MAVSKDSPKHRRKSIAVLNQNKPHAVTRVKRRAYSIVPGDRLSPLAKARRSLVPRKSILKSFSNIVNNADDAPGSSQQSQSSADDGVQSRDNTNTIRKSFGSRRVSFANRVEIRVIKGKKSDEGDSSMEQDLSPVPDASRRDRADENAYPHTSTSHLRGSSRHSTASSEDMDLTSVMPSAYPHADESAIPNEEFDYGNDSGMDMTEVLPGDIARKRSLSLSGRNPLSQISYAPDQERSESSFQEEDSQAQSEADSEVSHLMEFTVPLNQPLHGPAHQDPTWLALRQATHSGHTPIEPEVSSSDDLEMDKIVDVGEDMKLDDAVQRLMRARESLPSIPAIPGPGPSEDIPQDDTFSSMDTSFQDDGNQTMNVSRVFGQPRTSLTLMGLESTMDESGIYGAIALPTQSTPPPKPVKQSSASLLEANVFQPLPAPLSSTSPTTDLIPINTRPTMFTALPQRQVFTPPGAPTQSQVNDPPPLPISTSNSNENSKPLATRSPNKRLYSTLLSQPSPMKQSFAPLKRLSTASSVDSAPQTARSLSLSRKAPFEVQSASKQDSRPSLRRPSDYLSRRKSLGVVLPQRDRRSDDHAKNTFPEKTGIPSGRVSLGGVSYARRLNGGLVDLTIQNDWGANPEMQQLTTSQDEPPTLGCPVVPTENSQEKGFSLTPASVDPLASSLVEEADNKMQQWRNAVESIETSEPEEPPISIQQFFAITGIKFMDEITAPRRSIHPSQNPNRHLRNPNDIPLAEFTTSMGVDIPQLVLFSRVSKDLQAWIEKSKADFIQAEEEATKITPELFTEYSRADEEGQAELLHQLQLIRTNSRALAKSDWYDWKLQWLEGLRSTAENKFRALESDAKILSTLRKKADDLVPALKSMHEDVNRELEAEQAEVAEIEASDQDYLNELKASIAEQNIEVEALRAEVAEAQAQLLLLQERQTELDIQKQETVAAISDGQRLLQVQQNTELETLEDLHMFRATKVEANLFEYIYASHFRISLPCRNFLPISRRVEISRLDKTRSKSKDRFPHLSDFLLHMAKEQVVHEERWTTRQIVQRLSDYWSSCQQLRSQLKLVTIRYPVDIEILKEHGAFRANVMILFHTVKAKAFVSFWFDARTFSYWPITMHSIRCDAEVVYGNIDRETILNVVTDRLREATPANNYGCLLDACIEAQEIYH